MGDRGRRSGGRRNARCPGRRRHPWPRGCRSWWTTEADSLHRSRALGAGRKDELAGSKHGGARGHPKRQRSSVRFDGTWAALALVGMVDRAREQARADAASPSRAERLAREDASHTQAGDDPACGPRPLRSAATLRCLSAGVQYRAAPRKHRHETVGGSLPAFTARVSLCSTAHGVSRPLRGQARRSKRRDLESAFWSAVAGTLRRARRRRGNCL